VEEEDAGERAAVAEVGDGVGIEERVAIEDGGPEEQQRASEDGEGMVLSLQLNIGPPPPGVLFVGKVQWGLELDSDLGRGVSF
jgi:hypothetical protein